MSNKDWSLTQAERAVEVDANAPAPTTGPKPVDPNAWKCAACGRYHGPMQHRVICLENALSKAREENMELQRRLRLEKDFKR